MPNPTVTWIRHNWLTTDGSTGDFHAKLQTQLGVCSHWEASANGSGYTEARNKGANIPGFKALVAGGGSSGVGGNSNPEKPDPAQMQDPMLTQQDSETVPLMYVGLAPDGGTLASGTAWKGSTNPYNTARWSKYWRIAMSNATRIRVLENEEQLLIVSQNVAGNLMYAVLLGAIFRPLSDNAGESNGRIYGMLTTGSFGMASQFWFYAGNELAGTFTDSFFTSNTNRWGAPQIGAFLPESTSTFERLVRLFTRMDIQSGGIGSLKDWKDNGANLYVPYRRSGSPYGFVGFGRGWYIGPDSLDNQTILDGSGNPKGFTLGQSQTVVSDSIALVNS